ncbi:hypothetical protein WN55_05786 [Dufourea novaeangliae]|uniref:Transmembrane protein 126A n=2 Tax=Dufourea novaeangliae TaxID=178035 RepID=A0A154P217_DUFNO|nr:hypothetical protein WN55_05786 [Dufourea novaeangliae]
MCAASSIIINGLFRRKLKLYDRGLVLTSVYSLAGPSILGSFLYEKSITEDLMLYKHGCPLCYELKAAALINTTAILFPIITMPILNLGCAASLGLRVPYLTEVGELAKFWINVVKPASKHLATMFVMNSFIASMLARKQANSMDIIAKVVLLVQKDIREQETFSMIEQTEC